MKKIRIILQYSGRVILIITLLAIIFGCGDGKRNKDTMDVAQLKDWQIFISQDAIPNENYAAKKFHNYLLPCPNLWNIEPNIRFFVKNNAKGIFMQAQGNNTGGSFSDLRNYVTSRLLWNPQLSGEELIDEFLALHYGSTAPPIKKWLEQLRDSALKRGKENDKHCFAAPSDYGITPEIAQVGIEAMQKAMELADNEEIRKCVEKASIYAYRAAVGDLPFLLSAHRHSKWKKGLWNPDEKLSPEVAEHVKPYMKRLVKLCKKYEVQRWSEAWTMEDALVIWHKVFGMKKDEFF